MLGGDGFQCRSAGAGHNQLCFKRPKTDLWWSPVHGHADQALGRAAPAGQQMISRLVRVQLSDPERVLLPGVRHGTSPGLETSANEGPATAQLSGKRQIPFVLLHVAAPRCCSTCEKAQHLAEGRF